MYDVVKIACLSAALAGALLVAAGQHAAAPDAGKFLTDRVETQPIRGPSVAPTSRDDSWTGCVGTWPYRSCDAADPARPRVRLIAADSSAASSLATIRR